LRRFVSVLNLAFLSTHLALFIFAVAADVKFQIGIEFHVRPFSKRSVEVLHLSPKLSPTHHNHHHHLV
jgi:hypothetical protein